MGTIVRYGVLLGIAVVIWTFVVGFTGWYKHPILLNLFWLVIPIQVLILVIALRETARAGAGYGAQIGSGLAISSIAGIFVIAGSLLFTMVAFPDYFAEMRSLQEQLMREAGIPEARIAESLAASERSYTPSSQAIQGFIGTVVTGVLVSAIAAIWIRRRPAPA